MLRRIYAGLVALLLLVAGCADETLGPDPSPPDPGGGGGSDLTITVSIHTDTVRTFVGDRDLLDAWVESEPPLEVNPEVVWSSSDERVVTVRADDSYEGAASVAFVGMGRAFVIASVTDSTGAEAARDSVAIFVEWERLVEFPDAGNRPLLLERDPGSGRVFASTSGGLQASDDDGVSWYPVETGLGPNASVYRLAVSSRSDALLAPAYDRDARAGALLLSTDEGTTWEDISAGIPYDSDGEDLVGAAFDAVEEKTVYALTWYDDLRVYKSSDLGLTWSHQGTTFPFPEGDIPALFSVPSEPGHLYIGAHRSFRSENEGRTWNEILRPKQEVSFYPDFSITHVDRIGRAYIQDYNWDGSEDVRIHRLAASSDALERLVDRAESLVAVTTSGADERFIATLGIVGSGPGSPLRYSRDDGATWQTTVVPQGIYGDPRRLTVIPDEVPHLLVYIENSSGSVWRYRRAD